jgi:NSS family neurotransmitter:Na+ symporter
MSEEQGAKRGAWGSRAGFILAAAGSAVGLGNIWKFPYITGENGGGLFVLIYLACIAFVGVPIMMAEIMIGRAAQKQPIVAFETLQGGRTGWAAVGWLGVLSGFIILSYYIVVAGWALDFTLKSVVGFTKPIQQEAAQVASEYRATTSLEAMKTRLTSARAARKAKVEVTTLRGEASKAVWTRYKRFDAALQKASETEAARNILLEDAELAAAVHQIEALNKRVAEVKKRAAAAAKADIDKLSDRQIRDQAETRERRRVIGEKVTATFIGLAKDGWTSVFWAALFMLVTILVVSGGISGGIERACKVLMPVLIGIMLVMVIYGMFLPGFGEAVSFVFKPDASRLKASGVLEALGHAFFTLSLGMGAMITYGSYQKEKGQLVGQSLVIAGIDTAVALLACLMMFPIVFTYGQEASAGPGLVFISMPLAFAELGTGGMLLSILFFGLLVFAALTSAISLLEVVASYFIDQKGWTRKRAAWLLGGAIFAFSVPSAFAMDDGGLFKSWEPGFGKNFFDTADYLASNWMLPLGGLLISIYAGWVMPAKMRDAELEGAAPVLTKGWLLLVRWVAPVLVVLVLLQKVGFIDLG